ncbi:MAG: 4Fe-4S dicluster domain-containing protein [Syntrophomonadaceae bacterium]|nr:4Fe-4S dicluster domain-containing protein [Syntrophomonadaceae bacterium]
MSNRVAELALQAGIVGAGGAGFPTQVKLDAQVNHVIVNGAECEPLITVDQMLMLFHARELAQMAEKVRLELGAAQVTFAVKAKHARVITELNRVFKDYGSLAVFSLGDFYPAGDEVVTVYEVTGLSIPEGGIPLDVGVVVLNVETLWNLVQAEKGSVNTHKWLTVAGLTDHPGVYRAPLGIAKRVVLEAAGVCLTEDVSVIDGGPMMGRLVEDLDEAVTKTTKALLVLPNDNPVIVNARRDLKTMLRQARSLCCQCRICTDLCPRSLLGYNCEPNRTILDAAYGWSVNSDNMTQALACSECGACDMYSCPMGLSPRRINGFIKQQLNKAQITNPHKGSKPQPSVWRPYRRIPTARLRSRLNIDQYDSPVIVNDYQFIPDQIYLPLKQHIGAPATPVVKAGDSVRAGQLVAVIPAGTSFSSNLFSSIDGKVTVVDAQGIKIAR